MSNKTTSDRFSKALSIKKRPEQIKALCDICEDTKMLSQKNIVSVLGISGRTWRRWKSTGGGPVSPDENQVNNLKMMTNTLAIIDQRQKENA